MSSSSLLENWIRSHEVSAFHLFHIGVRLALNGGRGYRQVFYWYFDNRLKADLLDSHRNVLLRPDAPQRIPAIYKIDTLSFEGRSLFAGPDKLAVVLNVEHLPSILVGQKNGKDHSMRTLRVLIHDDIQHPVTGIGLRIDKVA